jgi:hypothetical protein
MLLDRHRVARLVELSALERVAQGAERLRGEEDVAYLIQAAYSDATEGARADFMARVKLPTGEWPWSAVRSSGAAQRRRRRQHRQRQRRPAAEPGAAAARAAARSGGVGGRRPGQSPARSRHAGGRPRGSRCIGRSTPGTRRRSSSRSARRGGSMPRRRARGAPRERPATQAPAGDGKDLPAPQPAGEWTIPWTHPAMLAAGAVVVVAAGTVLYTLAQERSRRALEEALASQEAS